MVTTLSGSAYAGLSLWLDTCGETLDPRPALPGDRDADVVIIGAGFTGLWTAYHLTSLDPTLRIVVVEAEIAGYGASGRNGGWCSALWPTTCPPELRRTLVATVDEVGRWADAEHVDVDWARGGSLAFARTPAQVHRLRDEPYSAWLSATEATGRVNATAVLGAAYDADCAAIHPGKLVRGLARVVERRGVPVYERTRVTGLDDRCVTTEHGLVRADVVIRATEGYTPQLPGHGRALVPVYSLVIATEPVPPSVLDEIGWAARETVTDGRRLIVYAQRTADRRIVFGGRGAPYHFGSRVRPAYDRDDRVHAMLRSSLVELWPALRHVAVTHAWGGPLGVPRDFHPSVGYDRARGLAWAGGYVGDGVAATNLAGRTLADLVLGRDTDLVRLPWVGHLSRHWEPEPLRWLGVNAGRWLAASIDRSDERGRRTRLRSAALARVTGK